MTKVVSIRFRYRFQASPPPGLKQQWHEYQVVEKRKILYRADTLDQAKNYCEKNDYIWSIIGDLK